MAIRLDRQYISFPLSMDIIACQVPNGQYYSINIPLYTGDTSKSCSCTLFLQNRNKINTFCTLSVINQAQDKVVNINGNFWAISTLKSNKKLYITFLQFSYSVALWFPYDIFPLPHGCKANAVTFVLPSNNQLNVDSHIKASENNLAFKRSYSKIDNFSLMQSLNISHLQDHD